MDHLHLDESIYNVYTLSERNVINMVATVQKWGNSLGIRIPKVLLDTVRIGENDKVELQQDGETITIKKVDAVPHRTLEERLVAFYGKPIEEIISVGTEEEYDWGSARGAEEW